MPCRRNTSIIFSRSGGPPADATISSASVARVRGSHDRRRYDGELFHILAAQIVEAVNRTARNTKSLAGTNLDGPPLNGPREDSFDTVENFFLSIVFVGWTCQLLLNGDGKLKH